MAIGGSTSIWIGLIIANVPVYWILIRFLFGDIYDFFNDFGGFLSGLFVPSGNGFDSIVFAFKLFVVFVLSVLILGGEHELFFQKKQTAPCEFRLNQP